MASEQASTVNLIRQNGDISILFDDNANLLKEAKDNLRVKQMQQKQ